MKRRLSDHHLKSDAKRPTISNSMKVVVRVRPPNEKEKAGKFRTVVDVVDDQMLIFDPKQEENPFYYHNTKQTIRDINKKENKQLKFVFDAVFGYESTNEEIFQFSTRDLIPSLLEGYNCSVFAYGATGAGKTHTMLGTLDKPGIIYLTLHYLFQEVERHGNEREFGFGVTYIEVYNEIVRNLLQISEKDHKILEDPKLGVRISNIDQTVVTCVNEVLCMLTEGNKNRTQHPTDANSESSRSHAIFQLLIRSKHRTNGDFKVVKLSMIDLAGSERGSATGCTGKRFVEGTNINCSLLALGKCINDLADGKKHIPYRDSKLTRILKDALGGNCRTVMLANVAPCANNYEDTYNTLKYAKRAKAIKSELSKNVMSTQLTPAEYMMQIRRLNNEIQKLKAQLQDKEFSDKKNIVPSTSCATPNTDSEEIKKLKEDISTLYERKNFYTSEILTRESRLKTLHWRYHLKSVTSERLIILSQDPDELQKGQARMKTSVNQYLGQAKSISTELQKSWVKLKSTLNDEREILARVNKHDNSSLKDKLLIEKMKMEKNDMSIEYEHTKQLFFMQQAEISSENMIINSLCEMLREHHMLLQSVNMVTSDMRADYEKLVKMLEGVKKISFDSDMCEDEDDDVETGAFNARELLLSSAETLHEMPTFTSNFEIPSYERWWSPKQLALNERLSATVTKPTDANATVTISSSRTTNLNETFCADTAGVQTRHTNSLDSTFLVQKKCMQQSQATAAKRPKLSSLGYSTFKRPAKTSPHPVKTVQKFVFRPNIDKENENKSVQGPAVFKKPTVMKPLKRAPLTTCNGNQPVQQTTPKKPVASQDILSGHGGRLLFQNSPVEAKDQPENSSLFTK